MAHRWSMSLSLVSRSSRRQLGIVVALLSIIPLLTFWHIRAQAGIQVAPISAWHFMVYLLIIATGITGYLVLHRYFTGVGKLRRHMEAAVADEVPRQERIAEIQDDIVVIKRCMDLMVSQLQTKVAGAEHERARLEEKLYQAKKMECLGTMAAGVAHDFNNLLAAIMGNAGLLLHTMPTDSPFREQVQHIEDTSLRALDLTNEIQAYAGQGKLVMLSLDLSTTVEDILSDSSFSVPGKVRIKRNLARDLPRISADSVMIKELIKQLIHNAVESISEEGGSVTLSTGVLDCTEAVLRKTYVNEAFPPGTGVYVEIADTGSGVSPQVYDRMFDPFFTTKLRGHGLGLSMAMGIIRGHSGTVRIESEEGNGTSFRAIFPAKIGSPNLL